ncbi:MAG: SpoIVB peptidase [Eubacteriales bacterium]
MSMRAYRNFLYILLASVSITIIIVWIFSTWLQVPSAIKIRSGVEEEFYFNIPATASLYKQTIGSSTVGDELEPDSITVDMAAPVTFYANETDVYDMNIKLFGIIPFKTTEVSVIEDIMVIPAGIPVGIYVKTNGVLVVATGEFQGRNGDIVAPVDNLLQAGDYILSVNGWEVSKKEEFMEYVSSSNGDSLILQIEREGEIFDIKVTPIANIDGEYKLGIWIRDNAQGVGTLTYVTTDNEFGALGHGINDIDTSSLMNLQLGELYTTEIISITKGENGMPGELTGIISYTDSNKLGNITANTNGGIFGNIEVADILGENEAIEIGLKQAIELSEAQILCTITGEPKWYDVMITSVHLENDNVNRGIELTVVDEELLEITGGIVQGMSGAPILQNGKMIGAVTHVFVNDPTRGYGIFIESMLETAESINN